MSLPLTAGRRLRLLQIHDANTQWWNLDEIRFCRVCLKPIVGKDIRITLDDQERPHFACPTPGCHGTLPDWELPRLHL